MAMSGNDEDNECDNMLVQDGDEDIVSDDNGDEW